MPELPEVEVTRQSLGPRILGARVTSVRLGKPLRWPLGCEGESLIGQAVGEASRRGKYLWLPLERGGLLLHLGMSGSLNFAPTAAPPGAHDHFDLVTTQGTLRLTDPRRFGAVVFSPSLDVEPAAKLLAALGLEPFDPAFTGSHLHAALGRRSGPIKQALLAGDIVPRCEKLAGAVRATLARAVALGGSTLRDFRDAHGMAGGFQNEARVYGRAGQACLVCAAPVRRIVQGQRATYFCARCQRR